MARALMFQGTGSDVGKTVLVAGLCRAARNRGIRVAPFKPQNMSNNAAVAKADNGEGEIGRGQWLQAVACGMEPSVHMNPVLLKPQSMTGSQVIVQGQVHGTARARDYQALKPKLLSSVLDSFNRVGKTADLVLVEGAGSPSEINLRAHDIANMGFASEAGVPVVLIGDIDRGGVIASIVGAHTILPDHDRSLIAGYLINKFRGDVSLFDEGLALITQFTGWPSFGILPWLDVMGKLPAEDSVVLDRSRGAGEGQFKVVVPAMGRIANFDDLDPLVHEPGVSVEFIRKGDRFPEMVDLVVLPGSKSTISDLLEFKENGWEQPLRDHVVKGGPVIGLCGGYQMLGRKISDPDRLEGEIAEIPGLGMLDVETVLIPEKIVRNSKPRSAQYDLELEGYEIHMGRTQGPDLERPMIITGDGTDGATSKSGKVMGCYLHGLFASDDYRDRLLGEMGHGSNKGSYRRSIDAALDEVALAMERHLDVDGLLELARSKQT